MRALRLLGWAVAAVVVAAWLALVEVFWLPLRVFGVPVPVSVVAAVVGNLLLVGLAARLTGSRPAAAAAGLDPGDALTPLDSGMTNASGDLAFPSSGGRLSTGLYLVVGHPSSDGTYLYTPESFLVSLPSLDENDIRRY